METPATLPWPAFRCQDGYVGFEGSSLPKIISTRVRLLETKRPRLAPSTEPRLSPAQSVLVILGFSGVSWVFLLLIAMALYAVS